MPPFTGCSQYYTWLTDVIGMPYIAVRDENTTSSELPGKIREKQMGLMLCA